MSATLNAPHASNRSAFGIGVSVAGTCSRAAHLFEVATNCEDNMAPKMIRCEECDRPLATYDDDESAVCAACAEKLEPVVPAPVEREERAP